MATGYLYDVWVANYGSGTVQRIADGVAQTAIAVGTNPYGICVDKDNAAWAATYTTGMAHKIVNGEAQTGITLAAKPHGICVDQNNHIWSVAYTSHKAIKIVAGVAQAGILLGNGTFAVCTDKNNTVWVANYTSGTVQQIIDGIAQTAIKVGYHPNGICVDRNNGVWVANYGTNTVQKIVGGVAQAAIAVGANPFALCVDKDNHLWVANYGGNTVQKIVDGVAQTAIPVGTNPSGVCIDKDNHLWVSNYGSNTVQKIVDGVAQPAIAVGTGPYIFGDGTGMQSAMLFGWGGEDAGPTILQIDSKRTTFGDVSAPIDTQRLTAEAMTGYLSDYWAVCSYNQVLRVIGGVPQAALTSGNGAAGVCVDRKNAVWIANSQSSTVTRIQCGAALTHFTSGTSGTFGICVDKNDDIWTCGGWENTIARLVDGVADPPIFIGEYGYLSGICCDKNNHIWVTNEGAALVHEVIAGVVQTGIAVGNYPHGICCDLDNHIWVVNNGDGTVQKIVSGVAQPAITVQASPQGICCDKQGNIWVANAGADSVQKIVAGTAQPAIAVGVCPIGIACDASNTIWVANNEDGTIQQIMDGIAQPAIFIAAGPYSFGDATGQQLALLFAGEEPVPEPVEVTESVDSRRLLSAAMNAGADSIRKLVAAETAPADSLRSLRTLSAAGSDTARTISGEVTALVDSWRYDVAGRITTILADTNRTRVSTQSLRILTRRSVVATGSQPIDTLRKTTLLIHVAITPDTERRKMKPEAASHRLDTQRQKTGLLTATVDTNRRKKAAMADFRAFSIALKARTLADSYSLVTLSPVALGAEYEGALYGWSWACTIHQRRQTGAEFSLTGGYGVSEMLKQYITFPSAQGATSARSGAEIMRSAAAQLGKTPQIRIDDLSVNPLPETTVLMDCISELFSWTASIPQQSVNVFLRGSTLHVIQRGKETSAYTLRKHAMPTMESEILTTLMAKEATGIDPRTGEEEEKMSVVHATQEETDSWEENVSGSWSFGGSSVTYSNGLCTQAVVHDEESTTITNYCYSPDNYVTHKTLCVYSSKENTAVRETRHTFFYGTWEQEPYLGQELVLAYKGGDLQSRTVTDHYPLGLNFYGTQERVFAFVRDENGNLSERLTSSQSSVTEGRPGGKSSPYTVSQSRKKRVDSITVTMPSAPTAPSTIPATDAATLQRYADGLTWLNGKTQFTCTVECYDEHIVDFLETVNFMGQNWYLEANTISLSGESPTPRQKLALVRWE